MDKKNILTKIKELFSSVEDYAFADYKTADGRIIRCTDDSLDVGSGVVEITEDGEVPLESGEYILEDGMILYVEEGKVSEIKESEEAIDQEVMTEGEEMGTEEVKMEDLETELLDGTKVRVVGGELAVGAKVEVEKDGAYVQAPEGQHNLADGRVIYVDADGLINEIQTPDTKKEDEVGMSEVFSSLELLVNKIEELTSKVESLTNENTELKTRVDKFAAAPSTEPIKKTVELKKSDKDDLLKFFAKR